MSAKRDQPPALEHVAPAGGARLALVLVLLSLVLLVALPLAMQGRLDHLQEEIEETVEPARDLLTELGFALALEVASARAYFLTNDPDYIAVHRDARARREAAAQKLLPLAARLDPEIHARAAAITQQLEDAGRLLDLALVGTLSPQAYQERLRSQGLRLRDILARANDLDRALAREANARVAAMGDARRLVRFLETGLVALALVAVLEVARLGSRHRALAARMEQHARQQSALRNIARSLAESVNVRGAAETIARGAVDTTGAFSAYVERGDQPGADMEVLASEGEGAPAPGLRVPYPGSLTEAILASRAPYQLEEVGKRMAPYLQATCPGCTGLVVPLSSEGQILGALVLLRGPGQAPFSRDEVDQARALGDLASAALRRVILLEALGDLLSREREARAEAESRRAELERVTESRTRLMRGFSHDVKNPLTAADGYLQLLERSTREPLAPKQRSQVERARRSLRSALDLISDLLDLARPEADLRIERSSVDLREVVAQAADEYRAQAAAAGLRLVVERPDEIPDLVTDPRRVKQILGNLLSNAVKYTERGRISVGIERRANGTGWLGVHVSDTGRGISEEQQRLLFQEFRRLDSGSGTPGAGIGLAISRRLARVLGGDLEVESTLGVGSTFTLWLPVQPAEQPREQPEALPGG